MARKESPATLVDHLVAAIVPALIMVMVGSLMFFLLDLWYEGPFLARLRWILFWFVLGIVLITRIGMQVGGESAKGYGLALGGAVALVATSLAGFQPFLLAVLGLVWWATHKLTYDCTLIDDDQDAGAGLIQESGLDLSAATAEPEPDDRTVRDAKRPHPPGVWLVYFALASLPIFGLGQALVPAVDDDRRAGLVLDFLAYIASGMGLLLATSFLNLRRYLRRRKIPMPGAMTTTWLTTGGVMIAGLTLAAAALLPTLAGFGTTAGPSLASASSDRRASRWAMLKDGGVQGQGAASDGAPASKAAQEPQESGEPEGSGATNDPNAARRTQGQGRPGGDRGPGRAKSGAPRGKPGASGSKGSKSAGKNGAKQEQAQDAGQGREPAETNDPQGDEQSSEESEQGSSAQNQGSDRALQPPSLPFQTPGWLRTLLLIVGGGFVLFGAFRYGPELLRGLWAVIAALLGGLWFGGPRSRKTKERTVDSTASDDPPRPFASFVNPFDAGLDHRLTPDDLVVYSFEALEAWAYERDLGRSPHETPTEFVQRLKTARPELVAEAPRLASCFVGLAYGRRGVNAEALPMLRRFWRTLEGPTAAPLDLANAAHG